MWYNVLLVYVALQMMGRNPSDRAIERYWTQAGGSLSFEQFSLVMRREKKTSMSDLMRAFRKIDCNSDGFITAQELQQKLTKVCEIDILTEVFSYGSPPIFLLSMPLLFS